MTESASTSASPTRSRVLLVVLFLVSASAVGELAANAHITSEVARRDDWMDALAFVRSEWQPIDVVTSAPRWTDPLLREAAHSLIDRNMAGRSDNHRYARLWALSIRGALSDEAPEGMPEFERDFGEVHLARYALPAPSLQYDFIDHIEEARVVRMDGANAIPCNFTPSFGNNISGGLQAGPLEGPRHQCDPARPWLWVGATTTMDYELRGRRCIWNHPEGSNAIISTYENVLLGETVSLYGGLWWEQERTLDRGDVELVVRVDGEEIGRMRHHDGDGWKHMEASIPEARRGSRGSIAIEVTSTAPDWRTFCWAGGVLGASQGGAP